MPENGNGKYISWKAVVGVAVAVLLSTVGLVVNDTRSGVKDSLMKIECLQKEKLDKELYYRDMSDIKETLQRMDRKLDVLRGR